MATCSGQAPSAAASVLLRVRQTLHRPLPSDIGKSAATLTFQVPISLSNDVFEVDKTWAMDLKPWIFFCLKKKKKQRGGGDSICGGTRQHNMHGRKARTNSTSSSVRPSGCTGLEAARGRCRWQHAGQCKLLKYLTPWKAPEDGFAHTTNASLQEGRASSYPGRHIRLPRDHCRNLMARSCPKDSYFIDGGRGA